MVIRGRTFPISMRERRGCATRDSAVASHQDDHARLATAVAACVHRPEDCQAGPVGFVE